MNRDAMFSSKTDVWETPQTFFDELNREFHFTCDVCAVPQNAQCGKFYTPEQNGLDQPWGGGMLDESSVWQANREMGQKSC